MRTCPWKFLRDGQKHIISLVGGGGKTTIMYALAAQFAAQGRRTVVLTTTHILRPALRVAQDISQIAALWQSGEFAVLGTPEAGTGKLTKPTPDILQYALEQAEVLLIEADGAKHFPCKLPAEHEPVLLDACDSVIAVVGLDALGCTLEQGCFRWQLGRGRAGSEVIDEEYLAQLLLSEQGARKDVGERDFYIALNKADMTTPERAAKLVELLLARGVGEEQLWLREKR